MKQSRHHGTITGISKHGDDHVNIEVTHGRRSPRPKGEKADSPFSYDSRPRSSMVLPKAHAAHYRVGQKVSTGLMPRGPVAPSAPGAPNDHDGDEGEELF